MLPQSQSLTSIQREQKMHYPLSYGSPSKYRYIENQEYKLNLQKENAKMHHNVSLPSLPPIKRLNRIEQTVQIYKGRPHRLPQLSNNQFAASEQQLQRRKQFSDVDGVRKSITPERKVNKRNMFIYAMRTKAGCQPNKAMKINQDAAIVCPKNVENIGIKLFGVCDGHGLNGHMVSNHIKGSLPKHLARLLKDTAELEIQIPKGFAITNREIWNSDLDTNLSGSTTVAVLLTKDTIISANVGDSRAILCRFDQTWKAIPLTRDHKPDDPKEKEKILEAGGRVEQQKDLHGNPIGPMRVWLSYIQAPGLAMSRSMGDKVGAQAGVTADPEIKMFQMQDNDQFIVVASDGVWEYLSNEEVMSIVVPYWEKDNVDGAAERIVQESISAWRKNSLARDDITCVVIFLSKQ